MKKSLVFFLFLIQTIGFGQDESVVCLHGFFRFSKCMIPMANNLQHEGLQVYLWNYPSRKRTIEKHAEDLVETLQTLSLSHPGRPIHFVTHSMGGIILRSAVNHPKCPQEAKIGRAILLAPPNKGSVLARRFKGCPLARGIFGGKAGRQLLTFSEEEMSDLGVFPHTMEILVVAGKKESLFTKFLMSEPNDGKVTVEETRLNSPHTHKTLYVSHHWIMTSRESIALTKEFLLKQNTP
jgi:pimeloyl-ACP methyl ester carboxylesterase